MVLSRRQRAIRQHRKARTTRDLYYKYGGKEKLKYSDFLKKSENPVKNVINTYEFTYSLDYNGENYSFSIGQETIKISLPANADISNIDIPENIKQQVSSIFKGNSRDWVYRNMNIETKQLRGVEEINTESNLNYENFNTNDLQIHNTAQVKVNKRNYRGGRGNTNKYNLNIWV